MQQDAEKTSPPTRNTLVRTNPATKLRIWWSDAAKWTKRLFGALAALPAIIAGVTIILHSLQPSVNPAVADARTLNSLRAGELFSAFEHTIKTRPTDNVWGRSIRVRYRLKYYGSGAFSISDYLFVLHTVYVEAFVASNGKVAAYTITSRTANMPQNITILGNNYNLGKTTLARASIPSGIYLVGDSCGSHWRGYFEISNTDGNQLNQTVAVGITSTGSLPSKYQYLACPETAADSLPLAAAAPRITYLEERYVTPAYLATSLRMRRKAVINAITITAPNYPVVPEMIALDPDVVAAYRPG